MTRNMRHPFLKKVLTLDAIASGATGLILAGGAGTLAGLTELPEELLRYAGLILLPFAAFVGLVAARAEFTRAAVWTIIACNAFWVADSLVLLVSGWVAPNAFGYAFVIAQAVIVAVLAELQYIGLRRQTVPA